MNPVVQLSWNALTAFIHRDTSYPVVKLSTRTTSSRKPSLTTQLKSVPLHHAPTTPQAHLALVALRKRLVIVCLCVSVFSVVGHCILSSF